MQYEALRKVTTGAAVILLTVTFVICSFAVAALLDEVARFPFYNAAVIFAVVVDSMAAFAIFKDRRLRWAPQGIFSRVSALARSSLAGSMNPRHGRSRYDSEATLFERRQRRSKREISSGQIQNALQKVHSASWGLPGSAAIVKPFAREEYARDAAHR